MRRKVLLIFIIFLGMQLFAQNRQLEYDGGSDGTRDFCAVPDGLSLLAGDNTFTVELWVNIDEHVGSGGTVLVGAPSWSTFFFWVDQNNAAVYSMGNGSNVVRTQNSVVSLDTWTHIAFVKAGTSAGDGIIYINGTAATMANDTPGSSNGFTGNRDLEFGIYNASGSNPRPLRGRMDDLRIWNVARSQSQIDNNKDSELTGSESGLVGYWQFNETSGQTITDLAGSHSGTLGASSSAANDDPSRITDIDLPLPVELSAFTAVAGNGFISLEWTTQSELNNLGFIVERAIESPDGPYQEIASFQNSPELQGQGNTSQETHYEFTDTLLRNDFTYYYYLIDVDFNGVRTYHGPISARPSVTAEIQKFTLHPNFPNPFNPETTIKFEVPAIENGRSTVELAIFNGIGQKVRQLQNGVLDKGVYEMSWDGRSDQGVLQPSGVYFLQLRSENLVRTQRMILLR